MLGRSEALGGDPGTAEKDCQEVALTLVMVVAMVVVMVVALTLVMVVAMVAVLHTGSNGMIESSSAQHNFSHICDIFVWNKFAP